MKMQAGVDRPEGSRVIFASIHESDALHGLGWELRLIEPAVDICIEKKIATDISLNLQGPASGAAVVEKCWIPLGAAA
jgi:hypothetical protein